ncbi:unnamed protein product [Prunus armeniaca]
MIDLLVSWLVIAANLPLHPMLRSESQICIYGLCSFMIPLHGSSLLWFLDGSNDGGDDYELIWLGGYLVHPIFSLGLVRNLTTPPPVGWVFFYPCFL